MRAGSQKGKGWMTKRNYDGTLRRRVVNNPSRYYEEDPHAPVADILASWPEEQLSDYYNWLDSQNLDYTSTPWGRKYWEKVASKDIRKEEERIVKTRLKILEKMALVRLHGPRTPEDMAVLYLMDKIDAASGNKRYGEGRMSINTLPFFTSQDRNIGVNLHGLDENGDWNKITGPLPRSFRGAMRAHGRRET